MIRATNHGCRWAPFAAAVVIGAISASAVLATHVPLTLVEDVDPATGRYLLPGDAYATATERLGNRVDKDPNALHAMRHASWVCSGPMARHWWDRRGLSPSERSFRRWQHAYCDGTRQDAWSWWYEHGQWIAFTQRHPDWPAHGDGKVVPRDFYAGLLRDAPAPDVRAGWMVMAVDGHMPWHYGEDLVAGTRHASELPRYQGAALLLVECDMLGGCGPDGVITHEVCFEGHDCRSDAALAEILGGRFTPEEMGWVWELHRRIVAARTAWARAHPVAHVAPLPDTVPLYAYHEAFYVWRARWLAARSAARHRAPL
jgi:hypothetical protein